METLCWLVASYRRCLGAINHSTQLQQAGTPLDSSPWMQFIESRAIFQRAIENIADAPQTRLHN